MGPACSRTWFHAQRKYQNGLEKNSQQDARVTVQVPPLPPPWHQLRQIFFHSLPDRRQAQRRGARLVKRRVDREEGRRRSLSLAEGEALLNQVRQYSEKTYQISLLSLHTDRRMQVVFHSLRHSCASILVNAGVELPIIAKILGHKTLAMTMSYSHVNDRSVKNAMSFLDEKQAENKIVSIKGNRNKRA